MRAPAASSAATGHNHVLPYANACSHAGALSFPIQCTIQPGDQMESCTAYHGTSAKPAAPSTSQNVSARRDPVTSSPS